MQETSPALILLDLGLPDVSGIDLLREFRRDYPATDVIVVTAQDNAKVAVECMHLGAIDFLSKPYEAPRFETTVRNVLEKKRLTNKLGAVAAERRTVHGLNSLIGSSASIESTKGLVRRVVSTNVTVLLSGESGTGKEVLARALHAESNRAASLFLAVNCGAIPEHLIESELFGHARGAFTGAGQARAGLFEQADGGTLFLDEIGELRLDLQVKLLRVLQEKSVRRIGCPIERSLDLRVIAATNLDLHQEVVAGRFRTDVYYRLSVFPVALPPLRERGGDILELATYFLEKHTARLGSKASGFTASAEQAMLFYHWPGNVRELENAIERSMLLTESHLIDLCNLPYEIRNASDSFQDEHDGPVDMPPQSVKRLQIATLASEERRILARALEITRGNVTEAAKCLAIGRATLYRKIQAYGLRDPRRGDIAS